MKTASDGFAVAPLNRLLDRWTRSRRKIPVRLADWMERWGRRIHRFTLATVFLWFGMLKVAGFKSATSLIAHTVHVASPEVAVPILGLRELAIAVCLMVRPLIGVALLLPAIRLPGTCLALVLRPDVCFVDRGLSSTGAAGSRL